MNEIQTGGPAFPLDDGINRGMTLRDYFAAKAMHAFVDLCKDDARDAGMSYPEHIAAVSYGMADAMLKARKS